MQIDLDEIYKRKLLQKLTPVLQDLRRAISEDETEEVMRILDYIEEACS